ncbi:SGNH/GDSL hydrolase family protein [Devosia sp. 2618]|uniref:SGNH/GDSL hydrolase family protein n=1 Tax=Devosia sp. 2618 TaxID=3156454 RepID=UPI003394C244
MKRRDFLLGGATAAMLSTGQARGSQPFGISCFGDSLTEGGVLENWVTDRYPSQLQSYYPDRVVSNFGMAGQPSQVVLGRFRAEFARHSLDTHVIWSGINNFWQPDAVMADLDAMVEALGLSGFGHGRVVVLTVLNSARQGVGTAEYEQVVALNTSIAARFGDHVLDIRNLLVAASGGENDAINPTWTSDGLHPTGEANAFIAGQVRDFIDRRGW